MRVLTEVVGPFQENSWLVVDEATNHSVFVDPGDDAPRLLRLLEQSGSELQAIWVTHGHLDHIGAIAGIKRVHNVPIYLHPADQMLYSHGAAIAAQRYGVPFEVPPPADHELAEGDVLRVGDRRFEVWHVPGHAPGHVLFATTDFAFGGDCLFRGSIGRTDLPFSDGAAMQRSLERIAALPPAMRIYPGHGPSTTIGAELDDNPFLTGLARPLRR